MKKYFRIINVMCNCKDQNANIKFKVFSNETSNIEFHFSRLQI